MLWCTVDISSLGIFSPELLSHGDVFPNNKQQTPDLPPSYKIISNFAHGGYIVKLLVQRHV